LFIFLVLHTPVIFAHLVTASTSDSAVAVPRFWTKHCSCYCYLFEPYSERKF